MDKLNWETAFFEEYRRRVGITYQDGGDPATAFEDNEGRTPTEAVTLQIQKYDLMDLDLSSMEFKRPRMRPTPGPRRRRR